LFQRRRKRRPRIVSIPTYIGNKHVVAIVDLIDSYRLDLAVDADEDDEAAPKLGELIAIDCSRNS
jgi:hypothetical protein